MTTLELETPAGLVRAHLHHVPEPRAALALGHGAGGGVEAPDLVAARRAATAEGMVVALLEQPYRVAGRRTPPRPPQLDGAWVSAVEQLRADALAGLPLVAGGRSLGGRVACRTAEAVGALAVLCLAFPLVPPRRAAGPAPSRLSELDAVTVPTLVVQGERDPFGIPPARRHRAVVVVAGDHALKADLQAVQDAVRTWLGNLLGRADGR